MMLVLLVVLSSLDAYSCAAMSVCIMMLAVADLMIPITVAWGIGSGVICCLLSSRISGFVYMVDFF